MTRRSTDHASKVTSQRVKIFDALAKSPQDFEQAKQMVVETVCGGLELTPPLAAGTAERLD